MQEIKLIEVKENILADNAQVAAQLREKLTREKTFVLNLMSSPGAGKTSLILKTIEALKNDLRIGIIEADIESKVDADKIADHGVFVLQLRTGGFCHIDASMLKRALEDIDLSVFDLIILENVGNLVCPAEFDTGALKKAMILSVPEGDDKPLKYPLMFTVSHALVLNKTDYLKFAEFDVQSLQERVHRLNPEIEFFQVSCKTGQGISSWAKWLKEETLQFVTTRS